MSFWGDQKWIVVNGTSNREIVDNFNVTALKDGCYRLSVGHEAIVSSGHTDKKGSFRKIKDHQVLHLEPGQFAYLITKEVITIPSGAIGFINVATTAKFEGLNNISGFHVDPLYSGKLIFTVFNAGPTNIALHGGQQLFRLWLSDFDGPVAPPKAGYKKIPREWASRLHGTYPSPFALASRLSELESRVDKMGGSRFQTYVAAGAVALFLLPFTASLYANVFYSPFGAAILRDFENMTKRILGSRLDKSAAAPPSESSTKMGH